MERTLIVLKPDAVQRQLVGRIIARFEQKGLKIVAMKMAKVSQAQARAMYAAHQGKEFYRPLVEFMGASPVVAMVVEGQSAVSVVREMIGPTFGPDAPPGTIRGDLGLSRRYNLVHGSDSPESADREIGLFFQPDDISDYEMNAARWVYAEWRGEPI